MEGGTAPIPFADELPNITLEVLYDLAFNRVRRIYQRVGILLVYSRL
jgi:hypothetical protein